MKSEVSHLQQKEIEYRMKIADQNKELARLVSMLTPEQYKFKLSTMS